MEAVVSETLPQYFHFSEYFFRDSSSTFAAKGPLWYTGDYPQEQADYGPSKNHFGYGKMY